MQSQSKSYLRLQLIKRIQQILIYKHRYKSRRALLKLDGRMLKDIGITKDQAELEGKKPFWKGDSIAFKLNEYTRFKKRIYLEKTPKSRGVSFR